MAGIRIDGKAIAQLVRDEVKGAVDELKSRGTQPCLATILVGDDSASTTYVKNKHKACWEAGIETRDHTLKASTTQKELNALIEGLEHDRSVHGILVQLPLPAHIDEFDTIIGISPFKDVDGLTPYNVGLLAMGKEALVACTPAGIMTMLDFHKIGLEGADVVVINRSGLIGKPLYHLLLQRNATVTTCHSKTKNLTARCKSADLIITAVGDRDKFELGGDMIKEGAVVIDVAISRKEGKLVGDCDYDSVIEKASYVTPVPGGVGPMTVAMLLKNTVTAASLYGGHGPGT